jgi:hypothetical protein
LSLAIRDFFTYDGTTPYYNYYVQYELEATCTVHVVNCMHVHVIIYYAYR